MTELKKLVYKLEDTLTLGKSLPVVAMRQLPKLAAAFDALPDTPDYRPRTQHVFAKNIMEFVNDNQRHIDDEREMVKIFTSARKQAIYSSNFLELLRT